MSSKTNSRGRFFPATVPKCSQIVEIVILAEPPQKPDSMLDKVARSKEIRRLDLLAKPDNRLQQLALLSLTANVSNKSGNLRFAQS
jgi:hypothetical protein